MVGIEAGKGFTLLEHVDQFALCGFSPQTKLKFDELLKQAIRVSALLHDDFKKPAGTVVPFSSATANDLKGWLQEQATGPRKKLTAVKMFYANAVGHHGLTWQPYLKGHDGAVLPRSNPAIWQAPNNRMPTPPVTPSPPKKRGRKNADHDDEPAIPERKRRAYAYSGEDSNFKNDTCHTTSSTQPEPNEKSPSTSAAEMSLIQLLRLARDPTRHRIAVASLPKRENRIVTIGFDKSYGVRYQIQNVNIEGDTLFGRHSSPSYKSLKKQGAAFLGRFAGASQGELLEFALELSKNVPSSELPLRDSSPSRKSSG